MAAEPASASGSSAGPTATVFLRPVATPLPLGFVGLTVATFVLSALQLGWIPARESHQAALVLLAFAFPLQLLASVFGFLCRDAAAATGIGVLGGTWLTVGLILLASRPGSTSDTAGLLLFGAGLVLLIPAAASGADKAVATAVLATAALRFFITGAYEYSADNGWKTAAGVMGLVLAAVAFYAALALELEGQRHRPVLPTFRSGQGRAATQGTGAEQVEGVVHEPGVRREL